MHFKLENFQDCRQKYQLTSFKSIICVWSCRYLKANPFSSSLNKISLIRLGRYSGSCLMSSLWEKLTTLTEWELSWLRNELTLRDWLNQINLIKITKSVHYQWSYYAALIFDLILIREIEDVYESQMLRIQSELLSGSICILWSQTIYSLSTKL